MVTPIRPFPFRYEQHYEASVGADMYTGGIDYMRITTGLGLANGSQGTISFWYRRSSNSQRPKILVCDGAGDNGLIIEIDNSTNGPDNLQARLTDGSSSLFIVSTNTNIIPEDDTWRHCLLAWDTNFSAGNKIGQIYVDDVDRYNGVNDASAAFNVEYNVNDWGVSNNIVRTSSAYIDGGISELWFDDTYIDISVKANRRKFISSSKRPVKLGSDGSRPTGSQPAIYLRGNGTGFNVNSGSGGDFTVTGTLTTPSDTPSKP